MTPPNHPIFSPGWTIEFTRLQKRSRHAQQHQTPVVPWKPQHGEGSQSTYNNTTTTQNSWKVVLDLWDPIKEKKWPPRFTRLSDAWAYLAVKLLSPEERSERYPADFDASGDLRGSRVPVGDPVVVRAHGLVFIPVYRSYYVFCGGQFATHGNWYLGKQREGGSASVSVGLVSVPDALLQSVALVQPEGGIQRRLSRHCTAEQSLLKMKRDESWRAAEAISGTFDRWAHADAQGPVMVYSMFPYNRLNYEVARVCNVPGFEELCDPLDPFSDRLLTKVKKDEDEETRFFASVPGAVTQSQPGQVVSGLRNIPIPGQTMAPGAGHTMPQIREHVARYDRRLQSDMNMTPEGVARDIGGYAKFLEANRRR